MAKIYYVGDWAVMTGPVFAESPFNYAHKGLDVFNYGTWLKQALESTGEHTVDSVPSWEFYKLPPGGWEEKLEQYDIFIFSDVEAKCFQLDPHFFDRSKFGKEILTFPDRIRIFSEAIRAGKSAIFCGGWLSFNGEMGKGGWGRTLLKDLLPVTCLETEDLVENTEGFSFEQKDQGGALAGLDFSDCPPILGYNKTLPREGFRVHVSVRETGDPLVASGRAGNGSVLAYMSDPAPHWGCNFVYWKKYNDFWIKCVDQLTR